VTVWGLEQGRIVGALASWKGRAAFHRAPLVLVSTSDPDRYLRINRYIDGRVEGEALRREDWDALMRSDEAMPLLPERSAARDVWLWLFRKRFALDRVSRVEELRQQQSLLAEPQWGGEDSVACLVAETGLGGLRDAWASQASRLGEEALHGKDAQRTLDAAETAFDLERLMSPRRVALLSVAYRLGGRESRAAGYVSMAERSMGAAFAKEVQAEIAALFPDAGLSTLRARRLLALKRAPMLGNTEKAA
jgi:hypothetical protein